MQHLGMQDQGVSAEDMEGLKAWTYALENDVLKVRSFSQRIALMPGTL